MEKFKSYIMILSTISVIGLAISKISEASDIIPDMNLLESIAVYHIFNYTIAFINNLFTKDTPES
jgi:hypothetical protein